MADDASLERFLEAAAALKGGPHLDPLGMFELLYAMREEGDGTLTEPLEAAMAASLAALAAPGARGAAFACYAFERVTIDVESRLHREPVSGGRASTSSSRIRL